MALVAAGALLVPAAAGLAVTSADEGTPVEVAALVERADGSLVVRRATASSASRGEAVVEGWEAAPDVVAAEVVQPVRALATDPRLGDQWGMTALAATQVWSAGAATSQLVAVLDTGVDASHPDLAGVVVSGKDLVGTGDGRTDPNGHGTHIAGIVAARAGNGIGGAGLAQGARILPVRVLDESGSGNDAVVAQGVLWAVEQRATVLNLSLAGDSPSDLLTAAIQHALEQGVVVVAGSGNSGDKGDPVLYPAATPGVLAVGAVDRDSARPAWSSTGSHLALTAPGASIVSTVPGGGYAAWSGTSMAAPFVAAAAALLKHAEPGLTPAQVGARLTATARDLGPAGADRQYGAGRLDVLAAQSALRPTFPAPLAPVPAGTAGGVAAPVRHAPAVGTPARVPVHTVRGSRSAGVVKKGVPVTFTARALRDGAPTRGLPVQLERRVRGGAWTFLRRGASGTAGLVSFSVQQDRTAEYRLRSGKGISAPLLVVVRSR